MFKEKSYKIAFAVSILLHLVVLLLYKPLSGLTGLLDLSASEKPVDQPLTFELVDPDNRPQELVETPDDAATNQAPKDARFLSDKNAQAQDMQTQNDLSNGFAFSEGLSQYKIFSGDGQAGVTQDFPQNYQDIQEQEQPGENDRQQEGELDQPGDVEIFDRAFSSMQRQKFTKDVLRGTQSQNSQSPNNFSDDVNWNNQQTSADALGGVSLSTYEWDFAPYILYMKRRIKDHLYPPPAFMQMGAISGEVTLRFVLRRDGNVRDLQFISNKGHKAFIDPSLNAIKASDPFKPLPDNFPDPYLELTWSFIYTIYK